MTDIPSDLRYSSDHLWARVLADGSTVRVGVTDFAQQSLGDVVDVTPPRLAETVKAGEPCGAIESTKSANDLVAPVTGTVRARHTPPGSACSVQIGVGLTGSPAGSARATCLVVTDIEGAQLIHPHPTQSEVIGETHLALAGKPLHFHG